jgi:hypothetical protein
VSGSRIVVESEPESGRSSVRVVRNARGDEQFEVKVYAGDSERDVEEARRRAVDCYRRLESEFGPVRHGAASTPD